MITTGHIFKNFDEQFSELRHDVLVMASLTEKSMERVAKGLFERDEDACNLVIAEDEEIDGLEVKVDHGGLGLILRYHPVAGDLRNVIAMMKFGLNLERIADQVVNIARRTRRMLFREPVSDGGMLRPLYEWSRGMVRDVVSAYADYDAELARTLKLRDKDLDLLNFSFAEKMTEKMAGDVRNIPSYLDLIFIARFFERIGDLAKAAGEDVVFAVRAEETRHTWPFS